MEERFLYSVFPKKPIRGILANNRPINSAKTLSLTIDEVRACMKCGTVYRRFANEDRNERVTTMNIERLHNAKFIPENDFVADVNKKEEENATGTVVNTTPDLKENEPIVNEPIQVESAPIIETKIEEPVEIEKENTTVEEVNVEVETSEESEIEENFVEDDEDVDQSEEDETDDDEEENPSNVEGVVIINRGKKKKKRR